ncbi:cytochrome c family protein [Pelagibius sp. CAU 1746]|uniref:c-type cytochrome n=1 Tax=Pelagibius sp. CAU 1746 TaxID=3140370 RepID=UPI00325B6DF2
MASSLESNKIAAAVLTAGVVAMLSGFVAELLYHPQVELEENSYVVAVSEGGPAEAAPADEGPSLEPIVPLLAAADPAAGEKVAKKCTACHSFDEGGPNKVGPNLYDLVNRPIGTHEGFGYSDDLAGMSGETWTYEHLNAFLAKPKDFAPGTKMSFAGLKKAGDRADLVAWLRTLSGNPAPLPE